MHVTNEHMFTLYSLNNAHVCQSNIFKVQDHIRQKDEIRIYYIKFDKEQYRKKITDTSAKKVSLVYIYENFLATLKKWESKSWRDSGTVFVSRISIQRFYWCLNKLCPLGRLGHFLKDLKIRVVFLCLSVDTYKGWAKSSRNFTSWWILRRVKVKPRRVPWCLSSVRSLEMLYMFYL